MEQSLSDGQEIHGSERSNWTWRGNAHATQRSSLHWGHGNTVLNLCYAVEIIDNYHLSKSLGIY